jgi:hypothetical protein
MNPPTRFQALLSFVGALAMTTWVLNLLWLTALAVPMKFLWDYVVAPLTQWPHLSYGRAFGLLLMVHLLRFAQDGVKISTTLRG